MMKPRRSIFPAAAARWLLAALAALALVSRAPAQTAPEERWLLVFDTSAVMKKRLPAVEAAVTGFFATSAAGQLHAGDSVGVWTFDQQLHAGQFPLTVWPPESAAGATSNLIAFIHAQRYEGRTTFAALQPALNRVIENSERLTVVIFCDGQNEITWTPYNDGINQTFRQSQAERKKARQPFVLLLRTQRGKFIGSTVNFPPCILNVPPFPALPVEVKPVPTNNPAPPPVRVAVKPPPVVPALVIIGTNISTNLADISKPITNAPPKSSVTTPRPETNSPASNRVAAKPVHLPAPATAVTNIPPPVPETNIAGSATIRTNAIAAAESGDAGTRVLLVLGGGLFVIALVLTVYLAARARNRGRGSLITSSMNQDRRPPDRN